MRDRYPPVSIRLSFGDATVEIVLKKRTLGTLLGAASGAFRRQAKVASIGGRIVVEDAELLELRTGERVDVA